MSETIRSFEIGRKALHVAHRLTGRTSLAYNDRKMFGIYTNLYPDPFKGDIQPGNYARRLDEYEARAKSSGRKVLNGIVGRVVGRHPFDERSASFYIPDPDLELDEGEFKDMIDSSDETREELEQIAACPDPVADLKQRYQHLTS